MSTGQALARNARILIGEHGRTVTFRRVSQGAYDPSSGTTGPSTTDDEEITAAFLMYHNTEVDGSLIQRGDRKVVFAASGVNKTPQIGDQFVGVGDTVNVVDVQQINSCGTDIVYVCQVRE